MNRVVAGVIGLAAAAAVLVGCSDDKSGPASATAAGGSQVSTGGSTEVKVDGKDLAGGLAVGIAVRLRSGILGGAGLLDADGVAAFPVVNEEQQPVTELVAWDHDWRTTAVTIGADVLAEVLAAESD